ncbi:MAG: MerR family transcriptional regulator [Halanaerobiaceae bacterium]
MAEQKSIPMRVVKEKTGLTSRQIRYYDEVDLIFPERSPGNQRLFSERDILKLKKIKKLINQGYNINSIKKELDASHSVKEEMGKQERIVKKGAQAKYRNNMLRSLYPVSNRSYLTRVLQKKDKQ